MRTKSMRSLVLAAALAAAFNFVVTQPTAYSQETTGGLQGTVKDPSGAVVPRATVEVTSPSLVGGKVTIADGAGIYRFANLPPGAYTITVKANGFETLKQEGITIEVGHLPNVDLNLKLGATSDIVEVTSEASPVIDVTTSTSHTNITEDLVQDVPHGTSFQSAIEFAPSARNEPLEGMSQFSIGNGNGATSPGSGSSGNAYGYSIAGGSDSENAYLVEGQETANIIGGYSHTNVPFDFIDEMVMDTTGIQAEHGGAMGGVINVIMQKGSNDVHGAIWGMLTEDAFNGSPRADPRYDPNGIFNPNSDVAWQQYQPKRPHTSDVFPGFRIGFPLLKNRLFAFAAFSPEWSNQEDTVTYNHAFSSTYPAQNGKLSFGQNTQTYYTNLRADAALGTKIHVFASLLDQGQHQSGETLPKEDSVSGLFNVASSINPIAYGHELGYSAPNTTYNIGLDFTATPTIVLTTRYGYFFENYHDLGYPTSGVLYDFYGGGVGGTDTNGKPLPADLQQVNGYFNLPNSQTYTLHNADKRLQLDQDVAFHKSGIFGVHDLKVGYQLNRSGNDIYQRWNLPQVQVFPGAAEVYSPAGATGAANCATLTAKYGQCSGQYGYVIISDYGTQGTAISYNHAFFGQDSWNIGKGLTLNYGVRFEKENVPSENNAEGLPTNPITFVDFWIDVGDREWHEFRQLVDGDV